MRLINLYGIPPLLASIGNVLLALLVLWKKPTSRMHQVWAFFSICLAIWSFGFFMVYMNTGDKQTALVWNKFYSVGMVLIPTAYLHFVLILTKPKSNVFRWICAFSYGLSILIITTIPTRLFNKDLVLYYWGYSPVRGITGTVYDISYPIVILIGLYLLVVTLRQAKGVLATQIEYGIVATLIGFVFGLSNFFPLYGVHIYPLGHIGNLIGNSLITYSIVRYTFMDIDVYIRKGLVYTVTTLSLTGIYFSTLLLSTGRISPSGNVLGVPRYILLILGLAVVFEPVRNGAQTLVDRLFFRTLSEQGRAIETFSKTLVRITDLSILLKKALDLIVGNFKLNFSSIWLISANNKCYLAQIDGLDKDLLGQDVSVRPALIDKAKDGLVVLAHDYPKSQHSAIRESLNEVKASVAIPLISKNRLLGLLFLGNKVGGRHLSGSEILLLKGLADHLALAIENSLISDSLGSDVDIEAEKPRRAKRVRRGEQTRPLLQRGLVYSTTTAIATSPLIAVFYHWSEEFARASQIDKIWSVAATVVVLTAVYEPIRGLINTLVDRYFYRRDVILRERVQEFASMAVSILDLDILLHQTVNRVKEIMGARWVVLMLPTTEDIFKPAAYSGLDDSVVERIALKPASQLVGHVSETGSAVLDSRNNHTLYRLTVPILMGGQLSGLLVLGDRDDNKQYSAEDMRLMNILAGQLAIAISNAELYSKTATDGLTRLYNRAYFDIRLEKAIKNARQDKTPLSVIIMDVDGFMPFSFENGRMAAEQALIDIAQELTKIFTRYKVIARFGEDEFSVILPDTDEESALFVARNVKRTVDELAIQGQNGKRKLTVSAGVATMKDDSDTCHKLTGRALTALQESKTVIESGEGSV